MKTEFNLNKFYLFYLFAFLIAPLGFIIRIFYIKTLSIQEFSFIYSSISFFNIIFLFTNLGLSSAIYYYIPKFIKNKDYTKIRNSIFYIFIFYFMITIIITIFLYLMRNYISKVYFKDLNIIPYFTILFFFYIGTSLNTILRDIFISFKLTSQFQLMSFVKNLFIIIGSILIFIFSLDKYSISIGYTIIWAISPFIVLIIFSFYLFKKHKWIISKLPEWDLELFITLFKYGLSVFMSDLGILIIGQTDIIIITYLIGIINSSIYSSILSLIQFLPIFLSPIAIILTSLISEYRSNKKSRELSNYLNFFYSFGFFFIMPFSLLFLIYSKQIIMTFFSKKFLVGLDSLRILALFSIFRVISEYNKNIMKGLGLTKKLLKITFIIAVINIVLDIIFIKIFGLVGAAIVTGGNWMLYVLITTYLIKSDLNLMISFRKYIINIFLGILFIGMNLTLTYIITIKNIFIKGLIIIIPSIIIYVILGNLFNLFNFKEILLFIPDKYKSKIVNIKENYFKFIK